MSLLHIVAEIYVDYIDGVDDDDDNDDDITTTTTTVVVVVVVIIIIIHNNYDVRLIIIKVIPRTAEIVQVCNSMYTMMTFVMTMLARWLPTFCAEAFRPGRGSGSSGESGVLQ